jgi:hypothetical protein
MIFMDYSVDLNLLLYPPLPLLLPGPEDGR